MKNKIINTIIIISILVLAILLIFNEGIGDLDELWQYSFANNLYNGLTPYIDFNIITTPLFPFIASIFLKVFSNQLIVMRIFNTIVFASILILAYKIFRMLKINKTNSLLFVLILYFLFYYDLGVEYNYLILLITLISLYFELRNTEKYGIFCERKDFLLGILIGLTIITKHTIGMILSFTFIFYKIIFVKNKENFMKLKKIIIYRLLGVLIPCIVLFTYLIANNALSDCINYCILGISEFKNKVSYFDLFFNKNIFIVFFSFIIPLVLLSFIGLLKYRDDIKLTKIFIMLIYSVSTFIGMFPIANSGHFIIYGFIGIMLTIDCACVIIKKIVKNKKIKIFIKSFTEIFLVLFLFTYISINLMNIVCIYKNNNICKGELEHYYGIIINKDTINHIQNVDNFVTKEKEKGNKVLILDSSATLYMIPLNIYNKDYDMFNKGNFGKDGESRIIQEITEYKDTKYLILKDEYSKNWQTPLDVIDYVKENKTKIGEIEMFDIYE